MKTTEEKIKFWTAARDWFIIGFMASVSLYMISNNFLRNQTQEKIKGLEEKVEKLEKSLDSKKIEGKMTMEVEELTQDRGVPK